MQGVFEKSGPIREKMEALHTELCDQMEGLLNEKQLKKWNKFYDSLCEDNGFVVGGAPFPSARNNSSRNSMGGNMMMDDMGMGGGDMW